MADVTPKVAVGAPVIQSYSSDGFVVGGKGYKGAVFIVAGTVLALGQNALSAALEGLQNALGTHEISYLVIGCGAHFQSPDLTFLKAMKARGIVVEPMTTPAACRTHNVLLAEERRFGTLLLPV